MGVSTQMTTRMMGADTMANFSGFSLARLFGLISPKISTTMVMTMVETVAPMSGIRRTKSRVEMEDMAMFTTLLPTRMLLSSWSYFSARLSASAALLLPFSAMVRSRVRFREEKAVSVAEK